MTLRRKLIVCSIVAIVFGAWLVAPRLAVWSMALAIGKGEESSMRARDRIVFFGERAIPSTIASIEKHSPWVRRYCCLPSALAEIGGSSRDQLLRAIERQDDPRKKCYLIATLQGAFEDFSCLDKLIEYDRSGGDLGLGLPFVDSDVRREFPDAPAMLTDGGNVTPAFVAYWESKSDEEKLR